MVKEDQWGDLGLHYIVQCHSCGNDNENNNNNNNKRRLL